MRKKIQMFPAGSPGRRCIMAGSALLLVFAVLSVCVPLFSRASGTDMIVHMKNCPPRWGYLFGTDSLGRDLWMRCWRGGRLSLLIGLTCMVINGCIGVLWGMTAGFHGRRVDAVLMRAADIIASVPSLLYIVLLSLLYGGGAGPVIAGVCVSGWIDMARIVRTEVIRQKHLGYVLCLRLDGMSYYRICIRHILPNIRGPVLTALIHLVPGAVFAEAFLSFLGVGIAAPYVSLGGLLLEAKSRMNIYPYQFIIPVVILCMLMTACTLLGRGIEEMYASRSAKL